MEQHSFNWKLAGLPNFICSKCGLIRLNNQFTDWCVRHGCDYETAPGYKDQCKNAMREGKK